MNEVPVAAFSASIDETGAFKLGNKFFHLLRHESPVDISSHRRITLIILRCPGQGAGAPGVLLLQAALTGEQLGGAIRGLTRFARVTVIGTTLRPTTARRIVKLRVSSPGRPRDRFARAAWP